MGIANFEFSPEMDLFLVNCVLGGVDYHSLLELTHL